MNNRNQRYFLCGCHQKSVSEVNYKFCKYNIILYIIENANFLDDLKSIVISTNGMSMTLLGSFINDSLDKWKLE